jgi:hypothetical protein
MTTNGNGNGFGIDPKWNSYIDTTVRETLEGLGQKVHALGLSETDQSHAELATARALIYAGCTVVWGFTEEDATKVKAFVNDALLRFVGGLESENAE